MYQSFCDIAVSCDADWGEGLSYQSIADSNQGDCNGLSSALDLGVLGSVCSLWTASGCVRARVWALVWVLYEVKNKFNHSNILELN